MIKKIIVTALICLPALVSAGEKDPLDSPSWDFMHSFVLSGEEYVFDDKVVVSIPELAEDPMNVPVSVNVEGLTGIQEIVVFADLNPIQKILRFEPLHIKPRVSFRFKVERSTPVRAAVKTSDGIWHVGGKWLQAAGGGCTAPSYSRADGSWFETLMDTSSRSWFKGEDVKRIRFRVMHPMDTGLADGIPVFHIQNLKIVDSTKKTLANLILHEPVGENPVFTFDLTSDSSLPILISGNDNNGNLLDVRIEK